MGDESRLTLIHRLFDAVQDVSADRRPQVLADLCADDSVRREVLELFSHDSPTAMDGVQQIVSRTLSFTPDGPPRIPGIELEEIIGAGAMGVVYRARQAQPKRPVAVKVLRGGHPSGSVVRRFKAEAEALARLRHPGIATVFEAGVDESESGARPYLVMELVEGEPLDAWMRTNRPENRATLLLAQRICDAVQHAHSRGVIHRDLKPSNILVTRDGQPKLVDFGVARISDPSSTLTMHTMAGEMVGTLAYMSPEQFSGDPTSVDTRSDVYALGVILFSMLTGELPHEVTTLSITEAARTIESESPKRLAAVRPDLRGDIDTIVAHALEKEKERRYQTAASLAEDIQRHLDGLPINARPASTLYVLGRLARRNRPIVAAAVVALAAVVVGVGWSVRSAMATREALDAATLSNQRVENINNFLIVDLLMSGYSRNAGANTRVIDVVDAAIPKVSERFADDVIGEVRVRQALAVLLSEAGRIDEAIDQLDIAQNRLADAGLTESREAVDVLMARANFNTVQGQPDRAEPDARAAIAIVERLELQPNDPIRNQMLAQLASSLQSQGKVDEAMPLLTELIDGAIAAGPPYPRELLAYLSYQYHAGLQVGWSDERLTEVTDRIVELGSTFDDPAARATAASFDAWRHERAGNKEAGLRARLRELEIARNEFEPGSYQYISAVVNAAGSYAMNGKFAESAELMLEGRQLYIDYLGPDHYEVERMAHFLSRMHEDWEKPEESRRWRIENLTMRFYVAGPTEMESLEERIIRAADVEMSEPEFIDHLFERLASDRASGGPHINFMTNLGRVLAARDDPRAVDLLMEALDAVPPMDPDRRPEEVLQNIRDTLPDLLRRLGRDRDAADIDERLRRLQSRMSSPN